jgi:prepilin-type N-terminal cleavage/methylation domain-containing protein
MKWCCLPINTLKNNKGFSLLEMIFVIVIAGAIILVIANIPNSIGLIGKSKHETIAKDIAIQKIEELRSITYTNLPLGPQTIVDTRISQLPGGSGSFNVENCPVEICTTDTESNFTKTKKVTVTLTWREPQEQKSVEITTLISEGGLQ